MSNNDDYDDYDYFDDGMDEYDISPMKAKAGGGGTNKSFHTGRGTRAKVAMIEKGTTRVQTQKNTTPKKEQPKKK